MGLGLGLRASPGTGTRARPPVTLVLRHGRGLTSGRPRTTTTTTTKWADADEDAARERGRIKVRLQEETAQVVRAKLPVGVTPRDVVMRLRTVAMPANAGRVPEALGALARLTPELSELKLEEVTMMLASLAKLSRRGYAMRPELDVDSTRTVWKALVERGVSRAAELIPRADFKSRPDSPHTPVLRQHEYEALHHLARACAKLRIVHKDIIDTTLWFALTPHSTDRVVQSAVALAAETAWSLPPNVLSALGKRRLAYVKNKQDPFAVRFALHLAMLVLGNMSVPASESREEAVEAAMEQLAPVFLHALRNFSGLATSEDEALMEAEELRTLVDTLRGTRAMDAMRERSADVVADALSVPRPSPTPTPMQSRASEFQASVVRSLRRLKYNVESEAANGRVDALVTMPNGSVVGVQCQGTTHYIWGGTREEGRTLLRHAVLVRTGVCSRVVTYSWREWVELRDGVVEAGGDLDKRMDAWVERRLLHDERPVGDATAGSKRSWFTSRWVSSPGLQAVGSPLAPASGSGAGAVSSSSSSSSSSSTR